MLLEAAGSAAGVTALAYKLDMTGLQKAQDRGP